MKQTKYVNNKKHKRKYKKGEYYTFLGIDISKKFLSKLLIFIIVLAITLSINHHKRNAFSKGGEYAFAKITELKSRYGNPEYSGEGVMTYSFSANDKEYTYSCNITADEFKTFHVGDCIVIYYAVKNPKVFYWERNEGTVRCLVEKKSLHNISELE